MIDTGLKIDIGCGAAKREGYLGIDYVLQAGVDFVVDVEHQPLPLEDNSVSHVYSAHVFEHIKVPNIILSEIGRVCRDGAAIEIITPYAFSDSAFVYGHVMYLTEMPWLHFCVSHRDSFVDMLRGRWLLHNINFVVPTLVQSELNRHGYSIDFAIKYLKGVVLEFDVEMEYQSNLEVPATLPTRTFSNERFGERFGLES